MNGKVSKTQVRRVSCGLIPDQTQKSDTIINNIVGYLFDDIPYLLVQHLYVWPAQRQASPRPKAAGFLKSGECPCWTFFV